MNERIHVNDVDIVNMQWETKRNERSKSKTARRYNARRQFIVCMNRVESYLLLSSLWKRTNEITGRRNRTHAERR